MSIAVGSTWRERSTISTFPVSRTTVGPSSVLTPRFEAERLVKEPIEIVFTVPSTVSGGFGRPIAGIAILPPIESFTRAPTPAAIACCTACGS